MYCLLYFTPIFFIIPAKKHRNVHKKITNPLGLVKQQSFLEQVIYKTLQT